LASLELGKSSRSAIMATTKSPFTILGGLDN
jgi:hypothetical protein